MFSFLSKSVPNSLQREVSQFRLNYGRHSFSSSTCLQTIPAFFFSSAIKLRKQVHTFQTPLHLHVNMCINLHLHPYLYLYIYPLTYLSSYLTTMSLHKCLQFQSNSRVHSSLPPSVAMGNFHFITLTICT